MNSQLHNQNKPFAGATLLRESVDKPLANGSFIMGNKKLIESHPSYTIYIDGHIEKSNKYGDKRKSKITKHKHFNNGYYYVTLCTNGICKKYLLHRLLAIAFIPNPENKPQVNHINGISMIIG